MLGILAPRLGERILEVGPGTGYYSLSVAASVSPGGSLDVQRGMLDHTVEKSRENGVFNTTPTLADAMRLPCGDGVFDAAFLVATLGEIPDTNLALCELRRVVKPGGRLVVGESMLDPHRNSQNTLRFRAAKAGFEREAGGALGYFARFVR